MNEILYERLKLIAEEAQEQGMTKLAEAIEESLPQEKKSSYSYEELQDDVHKDLWKIASKLMVYYDLQMIQPENLDRSLISWASRLIDDIEKTLEVNALNNPLEEKVAGEVTKSDINMK